MARKKSVPLENYNLRACDLCGNKVPYGPGRYDLKPLAECDLLVCLNCLAVNHDGLGPFYEERFLAHLKAKGIPEPKRNEKGFFPLR